MPLHLTLLPMLHQHATTRGLLHNVLAGEKAITRFLQSKPIQPMQAYALGVQSKYKSAMGDMAQARKLIEQAKSIDPYFSKATAAPLPDLFIPPTSISKNHRYLMRPF